MPGQDNEKTTQGADHRSGPLDGLLIADFSRVLAGPYCTMLLGDLGATVIKVESPAGDDTRNWMPPDRNGVATYYMAINRNKRSITLDFNDPADLQLAHELASRADVFIENFKPGGLKRFDLDYDSVQQHNAGIIYASISGFGTEQGASLPGYDLIVQAMSGLMSLTGDSDGPAYRSGISVFDVMAGLHATIGILAALNHRHQTGEGQHVEVSLFATALSGMVNQTTAYVAGGVVPAGGVVGVVGVVEDPPCAPTLAVTRTAPLPSPRETRSDSIRARIRSASSSAPSSPVSGRATANSSPP